MKTIEWNEEKDKQLKKERGVGFEMMLDCILGKNLLKIIDHPNIRRYEHQHVFMVMFRDYVFLTPFVQDRKKIFLKTIFPSRKYTKIYKMKGVL